MKTFIPLLLTFLLTFSCSHSGHHGEVEQETGIQIAKGLKGSRYGNIYFSGQPNKTAIQDLKNQGFVAVINLREKREGKYHEAWEADLFKKEGINYYNVPFSMKDEMSDEYIKKVTSKIHLHRRDGNILVHCKSGNKVSIWVGAHFHKDHEYSKEDARAMARKMGLTKKKAMAKLNSYLRAK